MQNINNWKKLEKYHQYVNIIWQKFINKHGFFFQDDKHIFLSDITHVNKLKSNKRLINPNAKKIKFDINNYFVKGKCDFIPKKILPKKLVNDIFKYLMSGKIPNWNELKEKLDQMSDYLLYSNINQVSIKKMFREKDDDTINILILGGGPTGLYIANYLNYINLFSPKINLLIIDNKIVKHREGFRLPYTRNRIYGLALSLFNTFFPEFPCIKDLIKKGGIEIKYLENILIILIYGFYIPIYFTNKFSTNLSLKKFIIKNNIDVIYDCTGDRLKFDYTDNISDESLDKIAASFFPKKTIFETNIIGNPKSKKKNKYQVIQQNNEFRLQWINHIENKFYLSIEIYDDQGKFLEMPLWSNNLFYMEDVKFFSKFHNKCLKIKKNKLNDCIKLFDHLTDLKLSKEIQNIILKYPNLNIKFFIIEPKIHHKILISSIIKYPTHHAIIIGVGDTIFSSHFAVGAGLNRLLRFVNHIIWYIQLLSK